MSPVRLGPTALALALAAACGGGAPRPATVTPATPATAPAVAPELAPVARTWIIAEHVLVKGSSLSPEDAKGNDGRTIDVGADSFLAPWQGTCDGVTHARTPRPLAEVMSELGIEGGERIVVERFGLTGEVTEFRLVCTDRPKAPPLTIYVAAEGAERAMTCFGGGCYLLKPF